MVGGAFIEFNHRIVLVFVLQKSGKKSRTSEEKTEENVAVDRERERAPGELRKEGLDVDLI